MSITNYSELQTAVSNWLHRSDVSGYAGDFITLGEQRLYNDLRVRAMESSLSSTVNSSTGLVALPSDYVELKNAYITTSPYVQLQRKTPEWIYLKYPNRSSTGVPKFIAREGSNFIFGPFPDSTSYVLTGIYYARLAALSSALNTIFTSYPGVYLFAALAETAPFLKEDKRVPLWEMKYKEIVGKIQAEDDREFYSGSRLTVTGIN